MSIKKLIPQSIKNIYHLFQAILANVVFGFPSKKIKIIGVTGTNGKTTTVQMIAKILEEAGKKTAMASTINFKLGGTEWINSSKLTTLSSFQIQKFISQAVKIGCEYLVLEVSSHSLDQYRTWGINFDTAVITNVTREHLDYHKTMDRYRQAKMKLFKKTKNAVINLDMEKAEEFLKFNVKKKYAYTTGHPELSEARLPARQGSRKITTGFLDKLGMTEIIKAESIKLGIDNAKYQIKNTKYELNLPGLFNIENALAATCVGMIYEISPNIIKKALESLKGVPGRMEKVANNRNIEIIIDYAVTPDSLEKLYSLIFEIKKLKSHPEQSEGSRDSSATPQNDRKIISVLGACGERDRGKRPMMGEIVSRYAEYVILTNEDPYGENPDQIIDEVLSGIKNKKLGENLFRIMDRREAIKKALQLAQPGDIFVITGKGAEEIMAIGDQRIPWNEKKVILEELEKLN